MEGMTCVNCGSQAKPGRVMADGTFWCWLCEKLLRCRAALGVERG